MPNLRFSVVIPCFNEAKSLPELIDKAALIAQSGEGEFIFVNNGSTDDSSVILQEVRHDGIKVLNLQVNRGYGGGILAGIEFAEAPIVGWTHADLQTPLEDILRALELFTSEKVFVKGYRKGRPLSNQIFSMGMGVFESILFRTSLKEINAQPTLFHKSLTSFWNPPSDFSLDLYAYLQAKRSNYSIRRFVVTFMERKHGTSSWNTNYKSRYNFIKRTILYSVRLKRGLSDAFHSS